MENWLEKELSKSRLKDERLTSRLKTILKALSECGGKSISSACNEWASTKAAYRFLSNDKISEKDILSSHFFNTHTRIKNCNEPVLILHDTTEFNYRRKDPAKIGFTRIHNEFYAEPELPISEKSICGVLMHTSLAILGLTAAKIWSRSHFKHTNQQRKKINPTRVDIAKKESIKWIENLSYSHDSLKTNATKVIHIGDRENDIYEYFSACQDKNTYFLIRGSVDRLANETKISEELSTCQHLYNQSIKIFNKEGKEIRVNLAVSNKQLILHPPKDKQKKYDSVKVNVVSATEIAAPKNRKRISWVLITNLPVGNKKESLKVLSWYKQRWKIEEYFKILKSGYKLRESKLRTLQSLKNLISMCAILSWRIQWITMLNRYYPLLNPNLAFSEKEIAIMNLYFKKSGAYLGDYIVLLARLGGYLNRKSDPPPGNNVIWRGIEKLSEMLIGFELTSVRDNICG